MIIRNTNRFEYCVIQQLFNDVNVKYTLFFSRFFFVHKYKGHDFVKAGVSASVAPPSATHLLSNIENERSHFGIKLNSLYKETGYFYFIFIYQKFIGFLQKQGHNDRLKWKRQPGKNSAAVLKWTSDLFRKWRKLFADNRFTSEKLFRYLQENNKDTTQQEQIGFIFQNHSKRTHCKGTAYDFLI